MTFGYLRRWRLLSGAPIQLTIFSETRLSQKCFSYTFFTTAWRSLSHLRQLREVCHTEQKKKKGENAKPNASSCPTMHWRDTSTLPDRVHFTRAWGASTADLATSVDRQQDQRLSAGMLVSLICRDPSGTQEDDMAVTQKMVDTVCVDALTVSSYARASVYLHVSGHLTVKL